MEQGSVMAKKKRPQSHGPRPRASGPPARDESARRRLTTRQLLVIGGIVTILGVGATLMIAMPRRPLEISSEPFPAPTRVIPESRLLWRTVVPQLRIGSPLFGDGCPP